MTVGALHAGLSHNVLPETAELEITVRAMLEVSLDRVVAAVERVVRAECQASACPREPTIERIGPVVLRAHAGTRGARARRYATSTRATTPSQS